MIKVSTQDILTSDGRYPDRAKGTPADVVAAAGDLASRLTILLNKYGVRPPINSGYRTPAANKAAGGAPSSCHLLGKAVDFSDNGTFAAWCLANIPHLETCGLFMEDPAHTKTWVHLQSRPTKNRVFKP